MQGRSWETQRKESGTMETYMLLFENAKQDVNLHDVLHRNYNPKPHKPCMLNPRPYVNPEP